MKEKRTELNSHTTDIMTNVRKQHWFLTPLLCLLVGGLVDSSSLSSTGLLAVVSRVGNQVVLPCSWKSRLGSEAPSVCHVEWATPLDTVFELRGEQKWEAEEFQGRVEVPEEKLGSGDCSLIITDVQIRDTGRYESFMVVDGAWSKKTKVFIQGVKLSVLDHKSLQSRGPGEDLVLDLYTSHSVRLVFQGRNSSEWSTLWMRGDEDLPRVEKDPQREQLTFRSLTSSDAGTYKVLDGHGLSVSTVLLTVNERSQTPTSSRHVWENQPPPTGGAGRSSYSVLLFCSVLLTTAHVLRLL